MRYCQSRFRTVRRLSRVVQVGSVGVGGNHPIRLQSMTTTPTLDVAATVEQTRALAEAGCEIVRITAQNLEAARALGQIRRQLEHDGVHVPLVADIHFLPAAALEAAEHVDKVRINPGNYADKKRFAVKEYTDAMYGEELERLHEAFSPIVLKCKALGRSMRIGTNHGSLSDRIMNRYGDSPLGMVESALEFLRIAESHGFRDIIISMKASNPKVMIQAYRLVVARMAEEGMHYPLHLGVTEAGDGDDARIKSAIGIGSLLLDGLGDTIRVSLTEDPVCEIPVARDLAAKAQALWRGTPPAACPDSSAQPTGDEPDGIDPYRYERREVDRLELRAPCHLGSREPPRVVLPLAFRPSATESIAREWESLRRRFREAHPEALLLRPLEVADLRALADLRQRMGENRPAFLIDLSSLTWPELESVPWGCPGDAALVDLDLVGPQHLGRYRALADSLGLALVVDLSLASLEQVDPQLLVGTILTTTRCEAGMHGVGTWRRLTDRLHQLGLRCPVWIRNLDALEVSPQPYFGDRLLEASILTGSLLADGVGDMVSVENEPLAIKALPLAYDILQGARTRSTKTEYVACPSCGRTLFDLQSTTQRIRDRTGHLKGVTIAVMGCIVNGPGEMADADFGYVGGAPGKVNLYVGKSCVQFNIPETEAVDRLVGLIREHGRWVDP